jgi:hypothetical protein
MPILRTALVVAFALALAMGGCAHKEYIPGTTVVKSEENESILKTIEVYRARLQEKNVDGLLVLASERYLEDSGTPRADDDYGYDGLKKVLATRLSRLRTIRYEIQYRNVKVTGNRAEVEVYLDGSFELASETGDRYRRVNDVHRFILERTANDKWKFLSGM